MPTGCMMSPRSKLGRPANVPRDLSVDLSHGWPREMLDSQLSRIKAPFFSTLCSNDRLAPMATLQKTFWGLGTELECRSVRPMLAGIVDPRSMLTLSRVAQHLAVTAGQAFLSSLRFQPTLSTALLLQLHWHPGVLFSHYPAVEASSQPHLGFITSEHRLCTPFCTPICTLFGTLLRLNSVQPRTARGNRRGSAGI
jgi:hypothetical protein